MLWFGFYVKQAAQAHVTQENVDRFKLQVFQEFLGHVYHVDVEAAGWQTIVESSTDYGFPVRRKRKWTHLRHKIKL